CPLSVACSLPVATSHSLTVRSPLPEASVFPSGLYATEVTPFVCPLRVFRSVGWWADSGDVATSNQQATPSHTRLSIRLTFVFSVHPWCVGHSSSSAPLRRPFLPFPVTVCNSMPAKAMSKPRRVDCECPSVEGEDSFHHGAWGGPGAGPPGWGTGWGWG